MPPRSVRSPALPPEAGATGGRSIRAAVPSPPSAAALAQGVPADGGSRADSRPYFEAADTLLRISVFGGEETLLHVNEFIRRYATDRYRVVIADSVALAAFELLENGFAFGSISSPVVFELAEHASLLVIRVSNRATAGRSNRLMEVVAALSRDAKAVYDEQLQQTVRTPTRGRLGLARIAHEAGMQIEARIGDGCVVVTAYRKLWAR